MFFGVKSLRLHPESIEGDILPLDGSACYGNAQIHVAANLGKPINMILLI